MQPMAGTYFRIVSSASDIQHVWSFYPFYNLVTSEHLDSVIGLHLMLDQIFVKSIGVGCS